MQTVAIEESEGRVEVTTPYSERFVAGARLLGGKWDAQAKRWVFDARDATKVTNLVESVYGPVDTGDDPTVTVVVNAAKWAGWSEIVLAGRRIARRYNRDEPVRLEPGVVCVKGSFPARGGSRANPTFGEPTAVLEVRDVPMSVARKMVEESEGGAVIADDTDAVRDALLARRARLVAELATIDVELAGVPA